MDVSMIRIVCGIGLVVLLVVMIMRRKKKVE
jgi:hypothetical protein